MPEFKISRFAYTWKGTWSDSTDYIKDDIVRYGGKSYVCIAAHTAQSDFYDDLYYIAPGNTAQTPRWVKMTDGFAFVGDWQASTKYNLGDVVAYGGQLYLVTSDFTSTSVFDDNISDMASYVEGIKWQGDWQAATRYGIGDLVKYNGIVYRCTTGHTSGDNAQGLEYNQSDWAPYYANVEYVGDWQQSTRYRANDLVKSGGTIFRCNTGHTSGTAGISIANFDIEFPGFHYSEEWDETGYYAAGDLVRHGGYLYIALSTNTGRIPGDSLLSESYWAIVAKGQSFKGVWDVGQQYKTGDVVRRGGRLYVATLDQSTDGSSLDYLDAGNWELVIPGQEWKNYWRTGYSYAVGDVVIYQGSAYECTYEHESHAENYPGDNGAGFDYWDILIQAGEGNGLSASGDLVTYGLSREGTGDTSTFGATNVPIGEPGQILNVQSDDTLDYDTFVDAERFFYVAPHGTDAEGYGNTIDKPMRTIRYACEAADDDFDGPTTVKVFTGLYEEVLPIIIPANTAVVGDELRAVSVRPKPANPLLADDAPYSTEFLGRLRTVVSDIILGNTVTPIEGNNVEQVVLTTTGNEASVAAVQQLIDDVVQYINYYVVGTGTEPSMTGTNTPTSDAAFIAAKDMLLANLDWFAEEGVAFMQYFYPDYAFHPGSCRRDTRRYIEAFAYDIEYTGNYKTLLAGRYYRNAVLGSETEDMFYLRDDTGLRFMTLEGLEGSLNPDNVYGLFKRPTGGSFASLDPGWGPDDERVWITTRSPYIQNCTTFGTKCIGQKIDGALHNGGNKSFVSNDFTQIVDDGIGVWVLNGGRTELVSIFTYYNQIGYLAEDGGIIRSTNGNNSYGRYGSIAVGNDPEETPMVAQTDARTGEAIVNSAFAGEVNDFILAFEYDHAGQDYTQADYTIVGSGVNAELVQEDFRDNAIFQARLINPQDSAVAGGSGFVVSGNNAQDGGADYIIIASNDPNEEANYKGMRIVITSGVGTGQYGIVDAYNTTTKRIDVIRESDGQPGWDHVVPGWPIADLLISSTTYRIEPRAIFSEPPYTSSEIEVDVTTTWKTGVFGNTYETYLNREAPAGSGETVDVAAENARFNIYKEGRSYRVTLRNDTPGAGYTVGDLLVYTGDNLGGITPDNDLTIEITGVTDDSTNSITAFTWSGEASTGRFVVTPATGSSALYSTDGTTWESASLPSSGNWNCVAAGALSNDVQRFVALRGDGTGNGAYSNDGVTWFSMTAPARNWTGLTYGNNRFVAVSSDGDSVAYSDNGVTWTSATIPDAGDSSFNEWADVTYGKGLFVAVASSQNMAAYSSDNGVTWQPVIMDVIDDSSQKDWVSVEYGNNRFVAISEQGDVAYSFDGIDWVGASMPTPDGSTLMHWNKLNYGNGLFFAVCDTASRDVAGDATDGSTTFAATSKDGLYWTVRELTTEQEWGSVFYGNPDVTEDDAVTRLTGNTTPTWICLPRETIISNKFNKVHAGAKAFGRVTTGAGRVTGIRMIDVGSGYSNDSPPTIQVYSPDAGIDPYFDLRIGDGVLGQPSWINRGNGYKTSTSRVTVTGDGFSDIIPNYRNVVLTGLERIPGPGAQLRFDGNDELYTAVVITPLGGTNGDLSANIQITPYFNTDNGPTHLTEVEIRERYSQCRITNHDYLDVGTGDFTETNYPTLYSVGYFSAPENEVIEYDGGRVFYTSTDQSGNFRCGELFAVEQATGIVTISAEYFDLGGLSELKLGGIRVGGSTAVIREFSTDPLFTEDSNNIVPTQRAIAAYLANRLSVGGSDIATASFIAGLIKVGPNEIRQTIGGTIVFPDRADFQSSTADVGVQGSWLAQQMFFKSFKDRTR